MPVSCVAAWFVRALPVCSALPSLSSWFSFALLTPVLTPAVFSGFSSDYYGFRDDDDGLLARLEAKHEKKGVNSLSSLGSLVACAQACGLLWSSDQLSKRLWSSGRRLERPRRTVRVSDERSFLAALC
jgi:hypothetical protein